MAPPVPAEVSPGGGCDAMGAGWTSGRRQGEAGGDVPIQGLPSAGPTGTQGTRHPLRNSHKFYLLATCSLAVTDAVSLLVFYGKQLHSTFHFYRYWIFLGEIQDCHCT